MEVWLLVTITVCISLLLKASLQVLLPTKSPPPPKTQKQLPPGPSSTIPILAALSWLRKSTLEIESLLRSLRTKFGPIITLRFTSRPYIFILNRSITHQALIQHGALFASRPKPSTISRIISDNHENINNAPYGSKWRLLRRNINSQILHPSKIKTYSRARKWVLDILVERLVSEGGCGLSVKVIDHFRFAMFCLLVVMCFGDKFDENQITEIMNAMHGLLFNLNRFQVLNFWPGLTKILLRGRWNELYDALKRRREVLGPLIRARKEAIRSNGEEEDRILSYVDTLLELELEDEDTGAAENDSGKKKKVMRKLSEEEMIPLCSEFLNAGTDSTSTALQWIMANLVKYPKTQDTLVNDIKSVIGEAAEEVREEDLARIPYLKAVVLEGLRRHPPGHFVLPHAVTQEDVELNGYRVPKNANINVLVSDIGWDPEVWENPMMFMPERFLKKKKKSIDDEGEGIEVDSEFDITGSKGEIKMMPFGVGRRICPGLNLALLHLEYFVANLVWKCRWVAVDDVDLSEENQFTTVMKYPLRAQISPRI